MPRSGRRSHALLDFSWLDRPARHEVTCATHSAAPSRMSSKRITMAVGAGFRVGASHRLL